MIEGIPIAGLTAPTLLGLAILMLLNGKLWTNNAYQQKCKEADKWEQAYYAERQARHTSEKQTAELLELAKTTHSFIVATFKNSERIRQSGGPAESIGEPHVVSSTKE